MQNLIAWYQEAKKAAIALNTAMSGSKTVISGMKATVAAIGGPWAIVAGGVAAATAALFLFNQETDKLDLDDDSYGEKVSDGFKEIARRAKEAGDEIRGVSDVLKYGAFYKPASELDDATEKMNKAKAALDKANAENKANAQAAAEAA